MTIPGARLRFVISLALIGVLPTAVLAAVQSGDGSRSFQTPDTQFMSTEGSGYYSFHLYSRFSPTSDGILSSLAGDMPSSNPGPIIVPVSTRSGPHVAAEPPNMRRRPDFAKPPVVPEPPVVAEPPDVSEPPIVEEPPVVAEPPVLADDPPPPVTEPSTLLLIGTGLLAAAVVGRRRPG